MIRHNGIEIDGCYIRHAGTILKFSTGCRRGLLVKMLILGEPQSPAELFDFLYGHDPDGGPQEGTKTIHVMMNHVRPELERIGLRIYSKAQTHTPRGSRKRYWVGPIEGIADGR